MANRIDEITPEMIDAYVKQGNELRAEAVRSYFAEFGFAVKTGLSRLMNTFQIPKTEQL